MKSAVPTALRAVLILVLAAASGAVLYVTHRNTRNAGAFADLSLRSTALALSAAAEGALRAGGHGEAGDVHEILSDRVVAYALIAEEDGTIRFHTNPKMAGTRLAEPGLAAWLRSGANFGRRIVLGTGVPAYEYNYVLHRLGAAPELLRIVLHTAAADRIVSDARRMWWTVGGVLALLWAAGILLEREMARRFRLAGEMAKRERLSLIGQMTASLAHEIRNALGSVKGFAQLAAEKREMRGEGAISAVLRGVARLESLVNELLLFSREEAYDLRPVDVSALARDVADADTSGWSGRVEIAAAPAVRAVADSEKLRRVLANGVRNGMEAMQDRGTLRVSVRQEGRRVAIRIEDAGRGVPEAERPLLFTPFHTTKTDGTGLGLAYSKKVVEGMGGRIELANRKEGGAVLSILLPSAEDPGHA